MAITMTMELVFVDTIIVAFSTRSVSVCSPQVPTVSSQCTPVNV